MYIEVVGTRSGLPAKSYGKVHAASYAEAIAMVFRNRAMYPRIDKKADNRWIVEESDIRNRIHRTNVRCQIVKGEK